MTQDFPFEKFLQKAEQKTNKNKDLLDDIFGNTVLSQKSTKPTNSVMTSDSNMANRPTKNVLNTNHQEDELLPITEALYEILGNKISPIKFKTFIQGKLRLVALDDGQAKFEAQTQFIKSTVESSYISYLVASLKELMGAEYRISVSVMKDKQIESLQGFIQSENTVKDSRPSSSPSFTLNLNSEKNEKASQAESLFLHHMEKKSTGQTIDKSKTFDNYVVGPSNNLAFATASAVSDSPGKSGRYPCVYLYSDSGLGKTHLLHAVANGIFENHPHLSICLISARDFMKELINAFKDKTIADFQRKYTESIDVLMIDDIHELKNKNSTQEEFFHIFNFLHDKGKQLIFTSDKSPDKITGIEERIITRLQWGLVIDIQKPDFETRTAILKKKAIDLDLFIQDDVLNLIASSIKTSIRELEGSLIRLQAHSELMEAEIDTEMARDILKLQDLNDRPAATLESVCRATSQYYKIPVADLRSKSRSKDLVKARHVAWYLSYNIVGGTYEEIAMYYGNRDHSTVIHGVKKISATLKNDPSLSKDLIFLENNI